MAHTTVLTRGFAALLLWSAALFAHAGEFFEPGGVANRGYDAVAGSAKFTATHAGSVFHFASAANRDAFVAAPERYLPQYRGFCAYAAALGHKAPVDPEVFTLHNGKLYLNFNRPTETLWRKDIAGYIAKADKNWPEVAKKPHP
jgi:YHS domain-containing protein